ncbi:MAG: HEPN domain-containing protein [Saprospiraceae bacterium]
MISSEQRHHLISLRIQQAEQAVQRVESCLENNHLELATNRIYYGMYYAMLALGLLREFETSKHMQMIGWFNKHFVHTGIFPKHFTRLVKDAFDARTDADYKINEVLAPTDLEAMLTDMKLFISTIKAWIEANPA